jgi:hypothetical protein
MLGDCEVDPCLGFCLLGERLRTLFPNTWVVRIGLLDDTLPPQGLRIGVLPHSAIRIARADGHAHHLKPAIWRAKGRRLQGDNPWKQRRRTP